MILKVTKNTDHIWRQKFKNIEKITPSLQRLIDDMKETLSFTGGVGLAAPQVGKPLRLFIINYADLDEVFINPKITSQSKDTTELPEGCLSVTRKRGPVARSNEVQIEYTD